MPTECTQKTFPFHPHLRREVVARYDGGAITSDGGGLLLREVEKKTRVIEQFASQEGKQTMPIAHHGPLALSHFNSVEPFPEWR